MSPGIPPALKGKKLVADETRKRAPEVFNRAIEELEEKYAQSKTGRKNRAGATNLKEKADDERNQPAPLNAEERVDYSLYEPYPYDAVSSVLSNYIIDKDNDALYFCSFNSTKKTKHPKKLLKYTSPSHPSTTSPHPLPPNTTINFVKLLIQQKLKEYASSRLRPTGTQRTVPTFPHYILNQSYVTKFNDLFHQFEYYKRGVDLVNGSNVGLAENINNIEQYFKDFGEHLEDVQKDMERGLKISVDPKDATEIRTTGFVRYMEKSTHPPVHEKFVMSTLSSAEMYNRTYHPFLQEVVDLMAQMRDYQERMPEDKAKQRFMEIINKDRVGADRFNSSEVFQLLRENYGVTDTQAVADTQAVTEEVMEGVADAATAEPIKIEEIRDETEDGKVVKGKVRETS
ncbi:uncharacterized protein LOC103522737, partial [Diaphorina citri]|uniref:Uncharacterized protein LOC103522737 n=1 Tax=Diaphorina citri TaxID=121845 RepID=A0A1S3DQ45_DIACI